MHGFIKLAVATLMGVSAAAIPSRASNDYALKAKIEQLTTGIATLPPQPTDKSTEFYLDHTCSLIFDAEPFAPDLTLSDPRRSIDVQANILGMLRMALAQSPECMDKQIKNITAKAHGKLVPIGTYIGNRTTRAFNINVNSNLLLKSLEQ